LEIYGNKQGIHDAFRAFIGKVPREGKAMVHQAAVEQLYANEVPPYLLPYALTDAAVRAEHICVKEADFYFDYVSEEVVIRGIRLPIPGNHNIENALAVITACLVLGVDAAAIREGMATFPGVKRRFEHIIRSKALVFLDDFAHHPVEISALMQSIRALYFGKTVTVVFQPHLYTRTRDLACEFAKSLDLADRVFMLEIYPAREEPIPGVSSACIFDQMQLNQRWRCTKENLLDTLAQHSHPEVLVTVGAGDISGLVQVLKNFLLAPWA
jgi:UDP-N-acetylmuramate--alanine ligase